MEGVPPDWNGVYVMKKKQSPVTGLGAGPQTRSDRAKAKSPRS